MREQSEMKVLVSSRFVLGYIARTLACMLLCLISTSCIGNTPASPQAVVTRDYWPTRGWRTTLPEAQGMNGQILNRIDTLVKERFSDVGGVLVIRHGYIVFEHYYRGYASGDYLETASVTKSFISTLIGIALQDKLLRLAQPVVEFFPDYVTSTTDPRKRDITIQHLLSMTSGWDWDPEHDPGLGERLATSQDQRRTMFDLPLAHPPGQVFAYKPVDSHLLSAIITVATGKPTVDYATERLFTPLGIPVDAAAGFRWKTDRQGYAMGPSGLHLTTHDMAKLGYLYLNAGVWDGQQIVPADYIHASTRTQSEGDWSDTGDVTYGYQWWVTSHAGHSAFFAAGYGGQFIYVVPDSDLVVVIVSDIKRSSKQTRDLISLAVLPAIED